MWKRITSGIVSILLLLYCLPIMPNIKTANAAYYPEGWKTWAQGDPRWGYDLMLPGNENIWGVGCWVSSFCKMYIQAGLVPNNQDDYDIGTFVKWCSGHGVLDGRCCITGPGFTTLLQWPEGNAEGQKFNYIGRTYTSGGNQQTMEEIAALRKQGKLVIVRQNDHHTILAGDPFTNSEGKDDVELYDTAATVKEPSILHLPERINFYDVYERADGKAVYPGDIEKSDNTKSLLNSSVLDSAEGAAPLYRLSRYNEQQKESLALLQNKQITSYELSALKWNMIVSQFTLPYINNISDTLKGEAWSKVYKAVSDTSWEQNPYLKSGTVDVNQDFINAAKDYLSYLQENSTKLNAVLKLLADEDNNVYTHLYCSNMSKSATVSDLLNDNALYVQDNITLTSTAVHIKETKEHGSDEEEITVDNQIEESPIEDIDTDDILGNGISSAGTAQKLTKVNGDTSSDSVELWNGLDEMYDISIKEAKEAYKSILEKSTVQTVNVPVFVATDSTALYNAIFISNAMELLGDTYGNNVDTSTFIEDFGKYPIFMDRWGNICAKTGVDKYVLVYPSYANPLFVSCELDDKDLAGVYYESLGNQLSRYNVSIENVEGKKPLLMTSDKSNYITVADAIKHIYDYDVEEDAYVFGDGTFNITTGLDSEGAIISNNRYNRATKVFDISEKSPPLYRFDTTTLAFANKTFLTMMSRDVGTSSNQNWYTELKAPKLKGTTERSGLAALLLGGYTSDGKLTLERFGTHIGLAPGSKNSTNTIVKLSNSDDDNKYSIRNGDNYLLLSKWIKSGETIQEYFGNNTKTVENSGPVIGYAATLGTTQLFGNLVSPAEYPFMIYFNGIKNIYESDRNSKDLSILDYNTYSLVGAGSISLSYLYQSTYSVHDDSTKTNISMLETLYGLEYLDSERYNIYFTTNANMANQSVLSKDKPVNRAPYGTYLWDITNNSLSKMIKEPATGKNTERRRLVSIPILFTALDDTASWGVWSGDAKKIGKNRNIDTTRLMNKGILYPFEQNTSDSVLSTLDYSSNGLKYLLSNEVVSSTLVEYPVEDIISIACIWDNYYIPNSPLGKKVNTRSLAIEDSLYDDNAVISPFNGINEENNNTLFWTRETNGSTNMILENKKSTPMESKFSVSKDIYEVNYNVPMFLLAVNKNADGENLARWVSELEDPASTSTYIMDLISAFMKRPITGLRNFLLGFFQLIHGYVAKGSLGTVFNIESLFNIIWSHDGLSIFMVGYGIFISIGLFIVSIKHMMSRVKGGLHIHLLRVMALGLVPIILISSVGKLFDSTTKWILSPVINKVLVTELEGAQRGQSKIQFGNDDAILLDNILYNQETFADLSVNILTDYDQFNKAKYTEVYLSDLYQSVGYNSWIGEADFTGFEDEFDGYLQDTCTVWYNNKEFVPVHYSKYKDSVFYYFYDWIKSSYIRYYSSKGSVNLDGYDKPDKDTLDTTYIGTIRKAEETYLDFTDGMNQMWTDVNFIQINSTYSDMFGLSNLFNMTREDGFPVDTYASELSIEDWAEFEYTQGKERLNDYDSIVNEDKESLRVSPIAAIICSPYWEQYKDSNLLKSNKNKDTSDKRENRMLEYSFTPDYLQTVYNSANVRDFSEGWTETGLLYDAGENLRTPWRLYASKGLLDLDTGHSNTKKNMLSPLESSLVELNDTIYQRVLTLCDSYSDSHISDDTMIFTFALIATFEFNRTFGGKTTSINLDTVSTDKLFRVIYATEIEDVIDNPNLVYMIFEKGGLFTAIMFVIAELLFILTMYLRCALYVVLILCCIIACFIEWFFKPEKLKQILSGLLIQIGTLIISQAIIILMLRLGLTAIGVNQGKGLLFTLTLLYAIICFALLRWHIVMFKSLIKNIRSFGYGAIQGEIAGLTALMNKASMKIRKARVESAKGMGSRNDKPKYSKKDDTEARNISRRLNNVKKMDEDNDEDDIV